MDPRYKGKDLSEETIFSHIHAGHRIFVGTACGEPQYLVNALIRYVEAHPKAFYDAEVMHVWTLGVAPYTDAKFKENFRHNSFFVGDNTRASVNSGLADYTPVFLSKVPDLFRRKFIPVDVALIQVSPPDDHGYMSLGVSVDITKAAVDNAKLVIAQVNPQMPCVHGDTFIHMDDVDFVIHKDEPLLEYEASVPGDIADRIGRFVSSLVEDGNTIQVGYSSLPNAILANLKNKKHLGVHTELFTDGIAELMRIGVVDNSAKSLDRGKTVATFCMGKKETYQFIDNNPAVEFKAIDYTNNPLVISRIEDITAINSALQIDLTGQSSAESIGKTFYSGIGGQADFMRGAVLSPRGKTILAIQSTAEDESISRIVPFLETGSGTTLTRGDIHYVVTEYGIAYLHGKNIRERAMAIIAIAHPKFQPMLISEAKKNGLIYRDQAFIPGKKGEYPEELEANRTTDNGVQLFLRPVKIADEPLLKEFFYSLSDQSMFRRFISVRKDMHHDRLQEFVVIDYSSECVILAISGHKDHETVIGVGQYGIDVATHSAEVAVVVSDDQQNKGIGLALLSYLTELAKKQGLLGFTAEVLVENQPMMHLFEKMGFAVQRSTEGGVYELKITF